MSEVKYFVRTVPMIFSRPSGLIDSLTNFFGEEVRDEIDRQVTRHFRREQVEMTSDRKVGKGHHHVACVNVKDSTVDPMDTETKIHHVLGLVSDGWNILQHQDLIDAMGVFSDKLQPRSLLFTDSAQSVMYAMYNCNRVMQIGDKVDLQLIVTVCNGHGGRSSARSEMWLHNRLLNQIWRLPTHQVAKARMNHVNHRIPEFTADLQRIIDVIFFRFDNDFRDQIIKLASTPVRGDWRNAILNAENKSKFTKTFRVAETALEMAQVKKPATEWDLCQILCQAACDVMKPLAQISDRGVPYIMARFGL